jgi:hypothetical protein
MAAMIKIGGADMPDPSTFKIKQSDLDGENTKRNEQGTLQRDRVRAGMHTLSFGWSGLKGTDAATVLQATSPRSFSIEFPDAETNSIKTITAYSGDKTSEYVNTPELGPHWNVSFDNIEY